jgi:hypothetical protein
MICVFLVTDRFVERRHLPSYAHRHIDTYRDCNTLKVGIYFFIVSTGTSGGLHLRIPVSNTSNPTFCTTQVGVNAIHIYSKVDLEVTLMISIKPSSPWFWSTEIVQDIHLNHAEDGVWQDGLWSWIRWQLKALTFRFVGHSFVCQEGKRKGKSTSLEKNALFCACWHFCCFSTLPYD